MQIFFTQLKIKHLKLWDEHASLLCYINYGQKSLISRSHFANIFYLLKMKHQKLWYKQASLLCDINCGKKINRHASFGNFFLFSYMKHWNLWYEHTSLLRDINYGQKSLIGRSHFENIFYLLKMKHWKLWYKHGSLLCVLIVPKKINRHASFGRFFHLLKKKHSNISELLHLRKLFWFMRHICHGTACFCSF